MALRTVRGPMINRTAPDEVALYRFFDSEEHLLYIGVADEPLTRWSSHAKREWWPDVSAFEVIWHPTRKAAEAAERAAILAEKPLHNYVFNAVQFRWQQFPGERLHALAWEHFGEESFSFRDLTDALGIPYGSAVAYGRRLADAGAFRQLGKRGRRFYFAATPPPTAL